MNWGDFQKLFRGVAWKRLTPHEVDPRVSNGHEFQGVGRLKQLLGEEKQERVPTTYLLLQDEGQPDVIELWSSWYDSRENNPNRSAEWRLYYPAEASEIQAKLHAGDLMVCAVTANGQLLILFARAGGDRERELQVLFDLSDFPDQRLQVREFDRPLPIDFATATLLEQLGLPVPVHAIDDGSNAVERIVDEFDVHHREKLPAGRDVAALVQATMSGIDPTSAPDDALAKWIEVETAAYRLWEDRKIARRLVDGFISHDGVPDVDGFRTFSMSLRQSRVSRAGGALQYHMETILQAWNIQYVAQLAVDEGELPDFVFPSAEAYADESFPPSKLRMLAAKHTAKDRWRQVLNEARRIPAKHMLTLDAAISDKQMKLMTLAALKLVIPRSIRNRYKPSNQTDILTVKDFLSELKEVYRLI